MNFSYKPDHKYNQVPNTQVIKLDTCQVLPCENLNNQRQLSQKDKFLCPKWETCTNGQGPPLYPGVISGRLLSIRDGLLILVLITYPPYQPLTKKAEQSPILPLQDSQGNCIQVYHPFSLQDTNQIKDFGKFSDEPDKYRESYVKIDKVFYLT
jgi:hypothetical protein